MKKGFFLLTLTLSFFALSGQDLRRIEKMLVRQYEQMEAYRRDNKWDSLGLANTRFKSNLLANLRNVPATFTYPFNALQEKIEIVSSSDKKLRAYSWNTLQGGTMRDYKAIIQYEDQFGLVRTYYQTSENEANRPVEYVDTIFTIESSKSKLYIIIWQGIYSSKDIGIHLGGYQLDQTMLVDSIPCFKRREETLSRLSIEYDYLSSMGKPGWEIPLIRYDQKNRQLIIPVMDERGIITPKREIFQFDGKQFTSIGIR
jgi:hypothetical protein